MNNGILQITAFTLGAGHAESHHFHQNENTLHMNPISETSGRVSF